jgi:hypothetical protein
VKPIKIFVPPSIANAPSCLQRVSSCCMTSHVPLWLALSSTHHIPCAEKCWTFPHTTWTYHSLYCSFRKAVKAKGCGGAVTQDPLVHQWDACISTHGITITSLISFTQNSPWTGFI